MADGSKLSADESYAIADSLAQASASLLDFRVAHGELLSDEQAFELERCEDTLDHLVVLFRGYGIHLIGAKSREAVVELQRAVDGAKLKLGQITATKKAIKIADDLVDLAVAVLAKDPKALLAAAKNLKAMG